MRMLGKMISCLVVAVVLTGCIADGPDDGYVDETATWGGATYRDGGFADEVYIWEGFVVSTNKVELTR